MNRGTDESLAYQAGFLPAVHLHAGQPDTDYLHGYRQQLHAIKVFPGCADRARGGDSQTNGHHSCA